MGREGLLAVGEPQVLQIRNSSEDVYESIGRAFFIVRRLTEAPMAAGTEDEPIGTQPLGTDYTFVVAADEVVVHPHQLSRRPNPDV